MPDGMPFEHAAALPHAGMLAIQGLADLGRLQAGRARSPPGLLLPRRLEVGDDLHEAVRVEAGPADERAVDVRQGGERPDVVGLDASAVEDVALVGRIGPEPLLQAAAD